MACNPVSSFWQISVMVRNDAGVSPGWPSLAALVVASSRGLLTASGVRRGLRGHQRWRKVANGTSIAPCGLFEKVTSYAGKPCYLCVLRWLSAANTEQTVWLTKLFWHIPRRCHPLQRPMRCNLFEKSQVEKTSLVWEYSCTKTIE